MYSNPIYTAKEYESLKKDISWIKQDVENIKTILGKPKPYPNASF